MSLQYLSNFQLHTTTSVKPFNFLASYIPGLLELRFPPLHSEHKSIFLPKHPNLISFSLATMTPPLTGFFMRAAGLGQIHKEIEKKKREGGRTGNVGPRQRSLSVGHLGQYQVARAPSRSGRNDPRVPNRPSPSSREVFRTPHGPTPFPRIHREDICLEALDEYGLEWSWDPDNDEYVVIKKHLTRQELNDLIRHTAWLRERRERDLALREAETTEQMRKLSVREDRNDARQGPERGRERDAERASTRDDRYAHGPPSGLHVHRSHAHNNRPPAPPEASTALPIQELPPPSHPRSQRSRAPTMSSRLNQPFSPPEYSAMEQSSQPPPQPHGLRLRNGMSQAPAGRPPIPSRQVQESYPYRPRAPSVRQGTTPLARASNIRPTSRRHDRVQAPMENIRFASPPHRSESLAGARTRNDDPRPGAQGSTPFARAPSIRPTSRRNRHKRVP